MGKVYMGPTERELRSFKHTLRYLKSITQYKFYIGKRLVKLPNYLPTITILFHSHKTIFFKTYDVL